MLCRDLTVEELFGSIPSTEIIKYLFEIGLQHVENYLAVTAMEELIKRGEYDEVFNDIAAAFEVGRIMMGTTTSRLFAKSLIDASQNRKPFLFWLGHFIMRAKLGQSIDDFIESDELQKALAEERGESIL